MKNNVLGVILASVISASFCLNSFAVPSMAENAAVSTTENVAVDDTSAVLMTAPNEFVTLKGEGTVESPYEIHNAQDFFTAESMVENYNTLYGDKVYELKACIDFNGKKFSPIGTSGAPFKGTLNGNGHKLFNITPCDTPYFGVIGYMEKGSISDLHAEYVDGTYKLDNTSFFGGIVGKLTVESSSVNAIITRCSAKGNLVVETTLNLNMGGVFGDAEAKKGNFYIDNCASYTNITVNSTNAGSIGGFAGKISAQSNKEFKVENCVAYGDVLFLSSGSGGYCGGFSGFISCDESNWSGWVEIGLLAETYYLYNCLAYGDVEITSRSGNVGGFGGHKGEHLASKFKNCVVPISQSVVGSSKVTFTSPKSLSALQTKNTLKTTYGFALDDVWLLDENKTLILASECGSCKTFSVSKDCVLLTGYEGEYTLTLSAYSGGVLTDIKFVPVTESGKIELSETALVIDGADTVKAFLFEKDSFFKPVCEGAISSLS